MEDNILAFIVFLPVFILLLIGWLIKYKKAYWLISDIIPCQKKRKRMLILIA